MSPGISPQLQKLLDLAGPGGIKSLRHLEVLVQKAGFTGPTTIHWLGGRAKQIDLGAPVRVSIVEGTPPGGLDKAPAPGKP